MCFQYSIGDAHTARPETRLDVRALSILHWRCRDLYHAISASSYSSAFQYSIGDAAGQRRLRREVRLALSILHWRCRTCVPFKRV